MQTPQTKPHRRTATPRRSAGFTLIEIAIVLVIIGLLLGGVLKGQEMIESGKVKNAVNDLNGITAATSAYRDRYRRMPGDDGPAAAVQARGAIWAAIPAGNNDGVLNITAAQTFSGGGENDNYFRHLRAAGLISGNPADAGITSLPRNAFGGLTGITTEVYGLGGAVLCMGSVPGKAAAAIDVQLDDGQPNTGSVRAMAGNGNAPPAAAAAALPTSYSEDSQYSVCRTA